MVHNLQSLGWRRLSFALNTFIRFFGVVVIVVIVDNIISLQPSPFSHDAIIQKETVPILTPAHTGRGAVNCVGKKRGEEGR